jgi:hypothetical protein
MLQKVAQHRKPVLLPADKLCLGQFSQPLLPVSDSPLEARVLEMPPPPIAHPGISEADTALVMDEARASRLLAVSADLNQG